MRARLRENASTSTGPTIVGCCDGARTSVPRFPQGLTIGPYATDGLRKLCAQATSTVFQLNSIPARRHFQARGLAVRYPGPSDLVSTILQGYLDRRCQLWVDIVNLWGGRLLQRLGALDADGG